VLAIANIAIPAVISMIYTAVEPDVPFHIPWEAPPDSLADARMLLDPPAGKHGFITARDGHLYFSDGIRARFWGTNLSGGGCFPPKEVAPKLADRLARFGFNLVRFHGMDSRWGNTIFDKSYPDTRHFDPDQLDRLDYLIHLLRERGIYINLNLHVGRRFTEADGVPQAEWLAYAKYCVIFDPRMIELQKEFARKLLTHRNPYTGLTYAEDPAVVIIELTNENSLFNGWVSGRLRGKQTEPPRGAWTDIPPYYAEELTRFYNEWLTKRYPSREALAEAWGEGMRKTGEQKLINGDFSGGQRGWELYQREPAAAKLEVSDEGREGGRCAKVTIVNVTDTRWHIMLTQRGLKLRKDIPYRVTFYAKASSPRQLSAEVSHAGPWRGYGSGRFELTTEWRGYEFTFVPPEDDDNVRLSFHLGETTGVVWVDEIVLQEAPVYGLRDDEDPWSGTVHRLQPEQFGSYTLARFRDEALFYFELERKYYLEMYRFLRDELRVGALIEGTNHNYGLPNLRAQSLMDLMDCHAYWQHPRFPRQPWSRTDWFIENTPMLDRPHESTIARLCRSSVLGKPFTVSEYNHPFPNEYGCEAPLIMAAYAALQDWDAVYFYTFGHRWTERELSGDVITGYFDICNDVAKLSQMPVAAISFITGAVNPARRIVTVSYSVERTFDSLREMRHGIRFFTDGELSPLLPLVHRFRVARFDAERTTSADEIGFQEPKGRIVSDTGELTWETNGAGRGLLSIDTPRLQAAIGWLGGRTVKLADVTIKVNTPFCAVSVASMDGEPISRSNRLLIVAAARCANTGMVWNEERTSIGDRWGGAPILIEPVEGEVWLHREIGSSQPRFLALDGLGHPKDERPHVEARRQGSQTIYILRLSRTHGTVWYAAVR
jgi:hypothetical protein